MHCNDWFQWFESIIVTWVIQAPPTPTCSEAGVLHVHIAYKLFSLQMLVRTDYLFWRYLFFVQIP